MMQTQIGVGTPRQLGALWGVAVVLVSAPAQAQSIASKYPGDQGIANDPAVVFSENFEQDASTFAARFTGGDPGGIATSMDHPPASSGVQSARVIPNGTKGTLYHRLASDYASLHIRYYVKYLGNVSHHAGGFVGGYFPATDWPQGDAGLKGVRPNGDKLLISALEQQGAPGGGEPSTRLDTYNNFVGMQGADFNGMYYGRNYLVSENVPLGVGAWQCIEMRVKLNTSENAQDGELQIWINGVSVQNFVPGSPSGTYDSSGGWHTGQGNAFPGLRWRDTLSYGINWIKLQNYSDVGVPYDVLFDDLVVATSLIGPIKSDGADLAPPTAPTNLQIM